MNGVPTNSDAAISQMAENFRFYGDARFKQLTLFMAAMTAVAAGILQFPTSRWWIALGGLYVAAVMWIVEVSATLNAIGVHDAIPQAFPHRPKFWPWLNASWAVLSLHITGYALWLRCIRAWYPASITFYFGFLVGVLLFLFSVVNYWRNRKFWIGPK